MRWPILMLAVLLAGCAASEGPTGDTDAQPQAPEAALPSVHTVVDATYQWHLDDVQDPPGGTIQDPAWLALGTAAPFCINQEEDEPYPFNLDLFQDASAPVVLGNTTSVRIAVDWDDADWIGEDVHPAWRTASGAWRVGDAIARGGEADIPVDPGEGWRLDAWLCLTGDPTDAMVYGEEYTPGAFIGDIDVRLDLIVHD